MLIKEAALKEIKKNSKFLKIIVEIGGCSGFLYDISYENDINDLMVVEEVILTDEISYKIIKDIEIDYITEVGYSDFVIKNPLFNAGCGCGKSFKI